MDFLIILGTVVTLIGLGVLIWCIIMVASARRNIKDDVQMRERLQKMAAINMLALFLSFIGLMIVVIGVIL
jgi:heme/copper-type cytochrome/quinol oxidase subunit 2